MEIELPDGTILEAPDGADPSVVAKGYLRSQGKLAAEAPQPEQGAARQVALAGRAVGEGVLGTLGGMVESFGKAGTGGDIVDRALQEYTGKNRMQHDIAKFNERFGTSIPEASSVPELLSSLLTKAGAPVPETKGEQLGSAVIRGASGGLTFAGGGVANAVRAAAAGASGAGASEVVRQQGGGVGAQTAAGLIGGLAPGIAETAVRKTVDLLRPLTRSGQQTIAGQTLATAASDPQAAARKLEAATEIVPDSAQTTGAASGDVGLLALEKGVRGKNTGLFGERLSEQNAARQAELSRIAGTADDIIAAKAARDSTTGAMRESAFNRGSQTDVAPVTQTIDKILSSPSGKREAVASALNWAKGRIGDESDPRALYEIRKDLQLAMRGKLQPSSQNAPNASTLGQARGELGTVVSALDDAIEEAAPGFKAYLERYKELSKPIDQMKVLQEIQRRAQSTQADITTGEQFLSPSGFKRALDSALQKSGKDLTGEQVQTLRAIKMDIDMGQAINSSLVKAPGSDTYQNLSIAQLIGAGKFGTHPFVRALSTPLQWIYKGSDQNINEILANAMLDPKLAVLLLKRATRDSVRQTSYRLRAVAAGIGAARSSQQQSQPPQEVPDTAQSVQ